MSQSVVEQEAEAAIAIAGANLSPSRMPLRAGRMVIGRAADADVRLDRNTVSRHHAELFRDPFGRWWVRDLKSRNGVRFGDTRVDERALRPGDVFHVGEFQLTFEPLAPPPPAPATTLSTIHTTDEVAEIRTLQELEAPKLAASHLSILIDFGRELQETEDRTDRLERLCRLMLRPEFGGKYAVALRVAADSGAADVLGEPRAAEGWWGTPHVSRRLLESVRSSNRPALASTWAAGPQVVQMTMAGPAAAISAVACPFSRDGRGTELLYVLFPPERGTAEWLAVASLAAEQFKSAESAWVARRQAQLHAAIEKELEQAREIQMRLVPRDLEVSGLELEILFRPSRWVGGDYVGVRPLPDGRVLLAVADVCGKGMAAALVASSLDTMLFASLRAGAGLAEIMAALSAYLAESMGGETFVTMACLLLDPRDGAIHCANAGHPPPLIISPDGAVRRLPSSENYPLGVASETVTCRDDRLQEGEVLAMYTDGITEARTSSGEWLGIERFARQLAEHYASASSDPLSGAAAHVDRTIGELQQGRVADDDLTLLLARRAPR